MSDARAAVRACVRHPAGDDGCPHPGRCSGQRGTAIITVCVLLFAVTFGSIMVLTRDVNRSVTNRSAAQSIAFQAARAGAQQVESSALRSGGEVIVLDTDEAVVHASRIVEILFDSYGVSGPPPVARVVGDTVEVTVRITDVGGDVEATATVQAQVGP